MGFLLAPTGQVAVPRISRMMIVKDKRAFRKQLGELAATPGLARLMFAHGAPITDDAPGALRSVVAQLGG
jgi:hypothetical protein